MANPQTEITPTLEAVERSGMSVRSVARAAGIRPRRLARLMAEPERMTLTEAAAVASVIRVDVINLVRPVLRRTA